MRFRLSNIRLLLAASLVLLTPIAAFSETPKAKKDTSKHLELKGKIVVRNQDLSESYKVEVLYFNTVTAVFTVKNNQLLKLSLKKDSPYVIKLSKKGYTPRYICINTRTYKTCTKNTDYIFNLETDFIKAAEAMLMDQETVELPAALMTFNKNTCSFDQNKDYSSFVSQRVYTALSALEELPMKD